MSTSDQTLKRQGRTPAWQKALITGSHANLIGRARQAAVDGDRAAVASLLVEIDTALAGMPRHRNGGGAWYRWVVQARNDLITRQTDLEMPLARWQQRR